MWNLLARERYDRVKAGIRVYLVSSTASNWVSFLYCNAYCPKAVKLFWHLRQQLPPFSSYNKNTETVNKVVNEVLPLSAVSKSHVNLPNNRAGSGLCCLWRALNFTQFTQTFQRRLVLFPTPFLQFWHRTISFPNRKCVTEPLLQESPIFHGH